MNKMNDWETSEFLLAAYVEAVVDTHLFILIDCVRNVHIAFYLRYYCLTSQFRRSSFSQINLQ